MMMTLDGHRILDRLQTSTGLSRSDIMTHLALRHAHDLSFDVDGVVYRHKLSGTVMSIRMTDHAHTLLTDARARTGKSYSDLGEALVDRWGLGEHYPERPTAKRKSRARRRR